MRDLTSVLTNIKLEKKSEANFSVSIWNLTILVCIVVFGFIYLFGINSLGTKGYEIKNLEQAIKKLDSEQKNLEMQVSNLQSINRIQQEANKLNFVSVSNVSYVNDPDFALK